MLQLVQRSSLVKEPEVKRGKQYAAANGNGAIHQPLWL